MTFLRAVRRAPYFRYVARQGAGGGTDGDDMRLKCKCLCFFLKTLFRRASAHLGRVEGSASARSAETTTTSDVAGTQPAPVAMFLSRQKCGSSVRIDREELPQHPHLVASTVGAPSCCGCWTRDWRAPSLPQVGTITVLNCVMAGAPASASRTPL